MLLTAGLGTRLQPVTLRYAKPAVPFLNVPLLYYSVALLEALGATELVMNTHHHPEQIAALARHIPGSKSRVQISAEPEKPLGSGGGVAHARKYLEGDGSFLVANGDEVILPQNPDILCQFLEAHAKSKAIASILVMEHPLVGQQFGGVWTDTSGRVLGFGKNRAEFPEAVHGYHYIGLLLLRDRVFQYLPTGESNILYDGLKSAIAAGETVQAVVGSFTWFETGNPRDFVAASGEALQLLAAGSSKADARFLSEITQRFWPSGTRFNAVKMTLYGPESQIEPGAKLSGFNILGTRARIATGALANNLVLLDGAKLFAGESRDNEILI